MGWLARLFAPAQHTYDVAVCTSCMSRRPWRLEVLLHGVTAAATIAAVSAVGLTVARACARCFVCCSLDAAARPRPPCVSCAVMRRTAAAMLRVEKEGWGVVSKSDSSSSSDRSLEVQSTGGCGKHAHKTSATLKEAHTKVKRRKHTKPLIASSSALSRHAHSGRQFLGTRRARWGKSWAEGRVETGREEARAG